METTREILFRGKRIDNGEWVRGSYVRAHKYLGGPTGHFIYDIYGERRVLVAPETVSEFTGLTDTNGTNIFEGDLLKIVSWVRGANFGGEYRLDIAEVQYNGNTGGFKLKVYRDGKYKRISKFSVGHLCSYGAEVIGNKWDNADFLESKNG